MVVHLFNVRRREGMKRGIGFEHNGLRWAGFENGVGFSRCEECHQPIREGWTCMHGRREDDLESNRYRCDNHVQLNGAIGVVQKGKPDPLLADV